MTMQTRPISDADAAPSEEAVQLLDQLPVGIFRKDCNGNFIFVNAQFCKLKATAEDQILGQTVTEIATCASHNPETRWRPELAEQECLQHALIMQTGRQVEREEVCLSIDGQQQYWLVVESAVFGADKTIVGSQGVLVDVTRSRYGDGTLVNERELLRALLDNSPDHIYFKDRQSRFIKSSTAQALQFGMTTPEGLVGKSDFDVFSEEHARPAFEDEQEIIRTGMPMINKVEKETWQDGRPDTWGLTTKMPLRNLSGQIVGTFGITKDISDLKEAERQITEVHKKLLEASRLAGMAEIATNVLHNVGNVLNSVNVSTELILSGIRASKMHGFTRAVKLIDEHADDLGTFLTLDDKGQMLPGYLHQLSRVLVAEQQDAINELLILSKNVGHIKEIIAAQQAYAGASKRLERMQIIELVDDALRINAQALELHHVVVDKAIEHIPALPLDKGRILQILVNLIGNAQQAMENIVGREPRLMLQVDMAPDQRLRVRVADNGMGIEPQALVQVFAHGFTTKKTGHGFGLHSAVIAAHEMGGTLTAHSDGPGTGATFTLELPVDIVEKRL